MEHICKLFEKHPIYCLMFIGTTCDGIAKIIKAVQK